MGVGLIRTKAIRSLDSGSRSLSTLELNTKRNKRLSASIKHHSNFDKFFKRVGDILFFMLKYTP